MQYIKNIDKTKLFSLIGLSFAIFGWIALVLALSGFFYSFIPIIFALSSIIFVSYAAFAKKLFRLSRFSLIVIIISVVIPIVFSFFATPSIFSGRDQGSLSLSAISLAQNHSLKSSFPAEKEFFQIYGPGEALNFPGFSYDQSGNLVTHFPIGYISYLAVFYSLFGIYGFIVANSFSLFLFLISFYAVSKNYLKNFPAITAFFLAATAFVFSWIFKFTLSENLALALIWFGIAQLLLFLKNEKRIHLLSFLASFGLLLFVRIEAIAFIAVAFFILFMKYRKKMREKIIGKKIILVFLAIIIIFIASFKINSAFYIAFAKGFINSFDLLEKNSSAGFFPLEKTFYVMRVFGTYAILTYLILAVAALIYFLKKKKYDILIPFFILLPSFFYVLSPSITLDHPWMLRRYIPAVIPISILYTVIFLAFILKKQRFFYVFSSILLLTNLMILIPYAGVRENPKLLNQIRDLSENFKDNDLVLIDRLATGDPWSMMPGPMNFIFGKQAVYFFNPEDLKKINLSKFEKVYLIIPDNNIQFYKKSELAKKIAPVKNYVIESASFGVFDQNKQELLKNPVSLPIYQKNYTYGKIYMLK